MNELVGGPHCAGCVQESVGQKFVYFNGQPGTGLMIVGDSPWIEEVRFGRPFAGASGSLLDSQLRRAGVDRANVVVTNAMCCKPPYLGWTDANPDSALAIAHCRPHLDELIERIQPKAIVTLGGVAMSRVLGVSNLVNRHGYIHDSAYGVPVVPSFHPSYILQGNHKLTQCLYFDLQRGLEVAKAGGKWQRKPVSYLIDCNPAVAEDYLFQGWHSPELAQVVEPNAQYAERGAVGHPSNLPGSIEGASSPRESGQAGYPANAPSEQGPIGHPDPTNRPGGVRAALEWGPDLHPDAATPMMDFTTKPWPSEAEPPRIPLLVIDLETPNSPGMDESEADEDPSYTIIRVALSVAEGTAVSLPWVEPYISIIKRAVASAAVVVVWNGYGFDLPRMRHNGIEWRGEVHDAMWMWHWLQSDMLKSLGFVAPFFTDLPAWKHLSGADLPYYAACDADAELRCYLGIRAAIVAQGRWPRFVRHCLRVSEIFMRPHVGRIHVDREAQAALKQRLIEEREAALLRLQTEVPERIKRVKVRKLRPKPEDLANWQRREQPCPCSAKDQMGLPLGDVKVEVSNDGD